MKLNTGVIVIILVAVAFAIFYFLSGNESLTKMDAKTFKKQINKDASGIVIDVRTQKEYDDGHLALADRHHDLLNGDFEAQLDSLDKNQTYYLYCRSGNRSGKAAKLMTERGFEQVYNIGGFQDLVDAGLESEK